MTISYDRLWQDMVAMVRANAELIATLAGAFFFFPDLLYNLVAPLPGEKASDINAAAALLVNYYASHGPTILLLGLVTSFGQATLLVLLLDHRRPTVRDALKRATSLFASLLAVSVIVNVSVGAAFLLLLVPGIYVVGRLFPAAAAAVAEQQRNPLRAVERSFALTRGAGWQIAGLFWLIAIVTVVLLQAVTSITSIGLALVLDGSARAIGEATVAALGSSLLRVVMTVLVAAVYRRCIAAPVSHG